MEGRRKNSESAFAELVRSNQVYFDQTLLVQKLNDDKRSVAIVLNSPSGFGKSVILSMCHAFTDKFADPALFDNLQLKTEHADFFVAQHNRFFDLYFDLESLQAESFGQFKAMLWLMMRDMINSAKHKLQRWLNHKIAIDHPDLQIIMSVEYQPALNPILLRSLDSLCRWIISQGIESRFINIYIDNHDACSRFAMINSNMSLCRDSGNYISQFLFFINASERPYFQIMLAGHEGVRDSKQLQASYQDMLEYINLYSGDIQLGLTAQDIQMKCPQFSLATLQEGCSWYRTCKQTVTNFFMAQKLLGLPQANDNALSSQRVLAGAISLFEYPNIINAYHTLNILGEPEVYKRDFYLSELGQYDSWFSQLLLSIGYITFTDQETAATALTSRMFVDIALINDNLLDEIESLLNKRHKDLQPHYAKQVDTLFNQRQALGDAFKNPTPTNCVML